MSLVSIDGVDLPAPSKYRIPNMDLDSSAERNELGILQRDRTRSNVFKVELEFTGITSSDLALIKSAISPAEFKATIITEIGLVTKKMYVGDRNIEMIRYDKDYNKIRWNISFNLTEY